MLNYYKVFMGDPSMQDILPAVITLVEQAGVLSGR
ncbi:hypothetical protein ALP99_200063 [Pseudomonas syringae pv. tomato]|jgi:hypothetical protein|uniref:Uncharacterized protein n=1 Tax=Pseudomonas syringae pv. tomato TaxID=323 RepID=A0AAQ0NA61_PSEUB|nr:hypothetical protein PST407_05703 [Pseudomonas syringae pv. tomato]KUR47141.1 hypothetical protein PSTA9_01781 [Pseudomonas syringae pv. tomato]RMQ67399.1 hypothetical protein ALP99_200063 [Pseudomonas syringae pv. tomato]RMQ71991.1 hypothetical protein ALQ00_00501 [Pseudomonas syringae pv. tomato]CAI8817403.1 hypothetical protein DAPPPG215_09505 [Pseudomonas syringae pv. tomato]